MRKCNSMCEGKGSKREKETVGFHHCLHDVPRHDTLLKPP